MLKAPSSSIICSFLSHFLCLKVVLFVNLLCKIGYLFLDGQSDLYILMPHNIVRNNMYKVGLVVVDGW